MYKTPNVPKGTLSVNNSTVGETIEKKIERILGNQEAITDGAPIIYTDRREGVKPETNVRTDRWDLALEGTEHITKSKIAKREEIMKTRETKTGEGEQAPGDTQGV